MASKYTRSLQTFFSPATASLVSKNCIAPAVVMGMDVVVERVGRVGESAAASEGGQSSESKSILFAPARLE